MAESRNSSYFQVGGWVHLVGCVGNIAECRRNTPAALVLLKINYRLDGDGSSRFMLLLQGTRACHGAKYSPRLLGQFDSWLEWHAIASWLQSIQLRSTDRSDGFRPVNQNLESVEDSLTALNFQGSLTVH